MRELTRADLSSEWRELLDVAWQARERAYAPYSHYQVGAAVRAADGQVYAGANVENAAYGLTICAERVALFCAVSSGQRSFSGLVVITSNGAMPCGSCRQAMAEFAPDLPILAMDQWGKGRLTTLSELLPQAFVPKCLQE